MLIEGAEEGNETLEARRVSRTWEQVIAGVSFIAKNA